MEPVLNRLSSPEIALGTSVATLAEAVAARHQSIDSIRKRADGSITVAFSDGDVNGVEWINPANGAGLGPYRISAASRFMTNLHRSFLAGDAGRVAAGMGALAMLMLACRLGGWRALLRPIQGTRAQRWHGALGRLVAAGLVLSSLTGMWMSASTFGFIPESQVAASAVVASEGARARGVPHSTQVRRCGGFTRADLPRS